MSSAITINPIAIAVGGWTAAVRASCKRLSDPHARPQTPRRLDVAQAPDATSQPRPVLTVRRAA